MTKENIDILMHLMNERSRIEKELTELNDVLKADASNVMIDFTLLGWHSGEHKMKLISMPKQIANALTSIRQQKTVELAEIQRKIDEL